MGMHLTQFGAQHGLQLIVRDRGEGAPGEGRYFASFARVQLRGGMVLLGEHGAGDSPEAAIEDYARRISGKLLAVNAKLPDERDVWAPQFQKPSAAQG